MISFLNAGSEENSTLGSSGFKIFFHARFSGVAIKPNKGEKKVVMRGKGAAEHLDPYVIIKLR